jgi:hypothetical protein
LTTPTLSDREFWLIVRQALLLFVDAIERRYALPRTADLRRLSKGEIDRNKIDCIVVE